MNKIEMSFLEKCKEFVKGLQELSEKTGIIIYSPGEDGPGDLTGNMHLLDKNIYPNSKSMFYEQVRDIIQFFPYTK